MQDIVGASVRGGFYRNEARAAVPVLSNITVWVCASASRAPLPFTRIPRFAARAIPEINATGAARIKGHGVAATSTARPRTGSPAYNHAPAAMSSVTGNSRSAYRSAIRMNGDFAVWAALTIRRMPA